jgi:hypothetical protein
MSYEDLNRYIDEHRCRSLEAILAGLEEHDLWKSTAFESGRSLARRLLEESVSAAGRAPRRWRRPSPWRPRW